jgi:2-polyprenyl-3-methyl-5-hydroxy-6-metoxy-1,4-benzoquinol methylase
MLHTGKNLSIDENLDDASYDLLLKEEGQFWGESTQDAMAHGIPPWVDIRNTAGFSRPVPGAWDDHQMHQILFGESLAFFLTEVERYRSAHTLDLGCGAGWLSLELARAGLHVTGIDVSEGQIDVARRYAASIERPSTFGSLQYTVADLSRLDLEPNSYDVITAWGALHHISALDHLLRQVDRALKPEGVFLVYDDIDWATCNHVWLGLAYLLIPGHEPIGQRVRKIYRRFLHGETIILSTSERKRLPRDTGADSPFEMVHGADILDLVGKYFHVTQLKTSIAMSLAMFLQISKGPDCWARRHRYQILNILKRLEDVLIRLGLAKGSMALLKAIKKDVSGIAR